MLHKKWGFPPRNLPHIRSKKGEHRARISDPTVRVALASLRKYNFTEYVTCDKLSLIIDDPKWGEIALSFFGENFGYLSCVCR